MATGTVTRTDLGIARGFVGSQTGDGTALSVTLGFRPKYVVIFNETDVIEWQKFDGQPDNTCVKAVAAGTMTTDTTSAIVINNTGFVTSAALNGAGKQLRWFAQ